MGIFDKFGKVAGGLAGMPGGFPGMVAGGMAGGWAGGQVRNLMGYGNGGGGDYSGMASSPTYLGMERNDLQVPINYDRRPLQSFTEESLRTGPSKATNYALDLSRQAVDQAKSQARGQAAGMAQNAQAQLAMKGGLTGGAAERIQKMANNNALDLSQQAEAAGSQNRTNLLMGDEQNRLAGLDRASGLNLNASQGLFDMQNKNLQNIIGEQTRRNLYNMNNYNQQMQAWGAGKQADAVANSGKK